MSLRFAFGLTFVLALLIGHGLAQSVEPLDIISTSSLDGQIVGVRFNQPLDAAIATNPASYRFNSGAVVTRATLRPDGQSVELDVTGLIGSSYRLTLKDGNISARGIIQRLQASDIGEVAHPSSAFSDAAGKIEVTTEGRDIWDKADSFHFAYCERAGDFDVCTRIVGFGPNGIHRTAKASLMLRESENPDSRHVTISVYPTLRNWIAYHRETTGGPTAAVGDDAVERARARVTWKPGTAFPNVWVRLRRVGDTITTYGSADGVEWRQVGEAYTPKTPFPHKVLVGLATSSRGQLDPSFPMADVRYDNFGDYAITNAVITFIRQPTSVATIENRFVTFSAAVQVTGTAASNVSYQWLKNGVPIPGATQLTYTTPLVTSTDQGDRYQLRASLPGGYEVFSDEAALAVRVDETPPAVHSIAALPGGPIAIRFNELMSPNSAADANRYRIDGVAALRASLMDDGCTVLLPWAGGDNASHQLSVNSVADLAGNVAHATVPIRRLDWIAERIGVPTESGLAYAPNAAEVNVHAAGGNIWTNSDSFLFVHRTRTGDFDVCVQMASLDSANDYGRGGLMVRENLTSQSRNFYICTYSATGENRWVSTTRLESGGATSLAPGNSCTPRGPDFAYPNVWFRLKRMGNTFTAYYGTNGVEWRQLGNQFTPSPPYSPTVYLGLTTTPNEANPRKPMRAQYLNFANWVTPAKWELKVSSKTGEGAANSESSTTTVQ